MCLWADQAGVGATKRADGQATVVLQEVLPGVSCFTAAVVVVWNDAVC